MKSGRAVVALLMCCVAAYGLLPTRTASSAGLDDSSIVARNAIVIDADTGDILYAKAADERVPPASLTKLVIAFVATEFIAPNVEMTVTEDDLIGEASMGLRAGDSLSFDALLHGMLMASGNDAANVVAREAGGVSSASAWQAVQRFLNLANSRVAELGMHDTRLANPHGLDEPGHYSTAQDLARLTMEIKRGYPHLLSILGTPSWRGEGHDVTNTNELLGRSPDIIAGKTGLTTGAGYCLVEIARRAGRTIVVVVMGSTADAWYSDAERLLTFGFAAPTYDAAGSPLGNLTAAENVTSTNAQPDGETVALASTSAGGTTLVQLAAHSEVARWRIAVVTFVGATGLCVVAGFCVVAGANAKRRYRIRAASLSSVQRVDPHSRFQETQQVDWGVEDAAAFLFGDTEAFSLVERHRVTPPGDPSVRAAAIRPMPRPTQPSWRASSGD